MQGGVNAEAFIERLLSAGVSPDNILELLLEDLENNGPVFGSFIRSMEGAASASVVAASRQGEILGEIDADVELQRLLNLADVEDVIDDIGESGNPQLAAELEALVEDELRYMSVATLEKTCHICLPLHGKTLRLKEWKEKGLHPDVRHPGSWGSVCKCRLVKSDDADTRLETIRPLVREKIKSATGLTASKKTARAVTAASIDKAQKAIADAMESLEGRRTLRLLGQANAE